MRFTIREHQSKGAPFAGALIAAGHDWASDMPVDVCLIDYDIPHPAYTAWHRLDAPKVVYPHGFSPTMAWDLVSAPVEVAASLVPGPGQKVLFETYGYPHPVHVVGWPGPRKSPKPRLCRHVVFAPHHPLGSGYMHPDCKEANAEAFRILLAEPFEKLTVCYVGTLEQNGLWHQASVNYVQSQMNGAIHPADVIVAGGTYAANCLAAGFPVVMYDQDRDWRLESESSPETTYPRDWREHRDFTRYPFILAPGVCQKAAAVGWSESQDWIERFMPPFDPQAFVRLIEEIVEC